LAVRYANPFIIGQCFESLSIEGRAATGCGSMASARTANAAFDLREPRK
jgi:hypothetical protein